MNKNKFYKTIVLLLFLIVLLPTKVDARRELSELRAMYPNGGVYSGKYTYSHVTCNESSCTTKISNNTECAGFATTLYREYFGADSSWGVEQTDSSAIWNIQAGDIVRFNEPSKGAPTTVGHSVFVLSRNGDYVTVAEANVDGMGKIRWDYTYSLNTFIMGFSYVRKAYFPMGYPSQAPTVEPVNINTNNFYESSGNYKLQTTWNRASKSSGYQVNVYKKSNLTTPFMSYNIGALSISNTTDFTTPGEYAVAVKNLIDEYSSKESSYEYFSVIQPSSISVTGVPTQTVFTGKNYKLTPVITPSNTNIYDKITWTSTNENIARVTSSNTLYIYQPGQATLTATTGNGLKYSFTINARDERPVESITLNETSKELETEEKFKLTATVNPTNADYDGITWKSLTPSVATVDNYGNVTAISRGTATIRATAGNKTASCTVTVRTKDLALQFTKSKFITSSSFYYLKDNLVTNDGSTIDWSKVEFSVVGDSTQYELNGNYLDFTEEARGNTFILVATYYGRNATMIIKPITNSSTIAIEPKFTDDITTLSLKKGQEFTTGISLALQKYYEYQKHVYLYSLEADVKYDPTALKLKNVTADYRFDNYQLISSTGTIHFSYRCEDPEDIIHAENLDFVRATFESLLDEEKTSYITIENVKVGYFKPETSPVDIEFNQKMTLNHYKYIGLESIDIENKTDKMELNDSYQLKPILTPANTTEGKNVSWSSSNENVLTIDQNGKVTLKSLGNSTITLKVDNLTKSFNIEVVDNTIYITDFTWDRDFSKLYQSSSSTVRIAPILTPANTTEKYEVTLKSSDETGLETYASYGYNFLSPRKEGVYTITATAGKNKITKTYTVTVLPPYVSVTGLTASLPKETIKIGETIQGTGTVTPDNASEKDIKWSTSNETYCKVTSDGKITGVKKGSCTITASAGSYRKYLYLDVESNVTGISLNKKTDTMKIGESQKLIATLSPSGATDNITWTSSDMQVAYVYSDGEVRASRSGVTTITAKTSNGYTATCVITVSDNLATVDVTNITLSNSSLSLNVGDSKTLTATILPSNATNKTIIWTSNDSSVATVSTSGTITAKKAGTTTIEAVTNNGKVATCTVTVKEVQSTVPVTSISLNKPSFELIKGETETLIATINPSNATNKNITWASSDLSVATVNGNGLVTAMGEGTVTITAKSSNGKTASTILFVVEDIISLNPTSMNMVVGETRKVTPTTNNNKTVTWTSSDTTVATVSNGNITALKSGKTIIRAKLGSATATCEVYVADNSNVGIYYQTHVQTYGWQNYVSDGQMSGTSGEAKRLEGIRIKLNNQKYSGDILYRTHVQTYGWQDFVKNNEMSGTSGEAKRLEAIEIKLTGEMEQHYDVYYRVHAQTYGWLDWAKNGQSAGTASLAKRLEAIEIVLVEKGSSAPGSTQRPFVEPKLFYQTHVQTYGWQDQVMDGQMSGTSGEAKRLEGIMIRLNNQKYSGDILYRTHVQTYGWQDFVKNGEMSGTSGEAKRLEAIEIKLTGEMEQHYDVYYRVHAQSFGWLDWAKNGQSAGTAALSKRLEAIEIVLVEKGLPAPGSTQTPFVQG